MTRALCMLDNYGYQSYTHNMQFLLLFYGNNGYANAPQKYVLHTLFILLYGNKKHGGSTKLISNSWWEGER
jgi:hypothetical protein